MNDPLLAEQKHTPGPWAVCQNAPNDQWYVGLTIFSEPTNTRVADVCTFAFRGADGVAANARLIAAAPDMLHALRAVLSVADRKTDEFDLARAAIAKATGTST